MENENFSVWPMSAPGFTLKPLHIQLAMCETQRSIQYGRLIHMQEKEPVGGGPEHVLWEKGMEVVQERFNQLDRATTILRQKKDEEDAIFQDWHGHNLDR